MDVQSIRKNWIIKGTRAPGPGALKNPVGKSYQPAVRSYSKGEIESNGVQTGLTGGRFEGDHAWSRL